LDVKQVINFYHAVDEIIEIRQRGAQTLVVAGLDGVALFHVINHLFFGGLVTVLGQLLVYLGQQSLEQVYLHNVTALLVPAVVVVQPGGQHFQIAIHHGHLVHEHHERHAHVFQQLVEFIVLTAHFHLVARYGVDFLYPRQHERHVVVRVTSERVAQHGRGVVDARPRPRALVHQFL